jgi:hypothetical protein
MASNSVRPTKTSALTPLSNPSPLTFIGTPHHRLRGFTGTGSSWRE